MNQRVFRLFERVFCLALWFPILISSTGLFAYPIEFVDDQGTRITVLQRPSRVVALVPTVSEILFKIGAGDTLQGITYHTHFPSDACTKNIVGGFFRPSLDAVESL